MKYSDSINVGDWVVCDTEGYGIVTQIHPIYYDIYCPEIHAKNLHERECNINSLDPTPVYLGDFQETYLLCKRFCKFDGSPIKSHKIRSYSKLYCDLPSKRDWKIINNSIKKNPKEYESFLKLDKPGWRQFEIDYWTENESVREEICDMWEQKISKQLPERFTAKELDDILKQKGCPIRIDNPRIKGRILIPGRVLLTLIFRYYVGDYRDKEILFFNVFPWY